MKCHLHPFDFSERSPAYRCHSNHPHAHQQRQNRVAIPLSSARLCDQPKQNKKRWTRHRLCLRSAYCRRGVCSIAPPISDLHRANAKTWSYRLSGAPILQAGRGYAGGSQCHRLRICQPLFEGKSYVYDTTQENSGGQTDAGKKSPSQDSVLVGIIINLSTIAFLPYWLSNHAQWLFICSFSSLRLICSWKTLSALFDESIIRISIFSFYTLLTQFRP